MPSVKPNLWMVFDVESVGLHGEGFAVGWVVVDARGTEVEARREACPPDAAAGEEGVRGWVRASCPAFESRHATPAEVRAAFWERWLDWRAAGAGLAADCAWPVEARFLAACVDDDPKARGWAGPYPLHDVATLRVAAGLDPLATSGRLPNELPAHDPLADARQSARLLLEALR